MRHAHSTANETDAPLGMTAEDLAFANRSAKLTDKGETQCLKAATFLPAQYGITVTSTRVAVSEYVRTYQTAELVGFHEDLIKRYSQLDEVDHGMDLAALREMLGQNQIPSIALRAAEAVLHTPPPEGLWITHGLLIAGLCIVLGTAGQYERPVPRQCEVRQLTF